MDRTERIRLGADQLDQTNQIWPDEHTGQEGPDWTGCYDKYNPIASIYYFCDILFRGWGGGGGGGGEMRGKGGGRGRAGKGRPFFFL